MISLYRFIHIIARNLDIDNAELIILRRNKAQIY